MPAEEVRLSPGGKKAGYSAAAWLIGWVVFLGSGYLTSLLLFSHGSCSSGVCAGRRLAGSGAGIGTATVIMNV
ncbi:hypothetical protein, partial [Streptomyces sp. NPDC056190]|uniref:hypothetical protein n=1 Tax=Streptomyces sp. NPDC056190 TaxID=3345741 RepID=UPI0035E37653